MKCSNQKCGKSHFPRTDPAIITLISFQDKVLLGRSPRFPDSMYSTLAGFVEPGESLEQATTASEGFDIFFEYPLHLFSKKDVSRPFPEIVPPF